MKCPFKKIITTKDDGNGNIKSITEFGECHGRDCMGYESYRCMMMLKEHKL